MSQDTYVICYVSGETANGDYPGEAIRMMANTCVEAESIIDYDGVDTKIRLDTLAAFGCLSAPESVCSSAVTCAWDLKASLIVVISETGNSARMIAKYRPLAPIYVLTNNAYVARQTTGYMKNCFATALPNTHGSEALCTSAIAECKTKGLVKSGENVVCVYGSKECVGATNMVRIMTVV